MRCRRLRVIGRIVSNELGILQGLNRSYQVLNFPALKGGEPVGMHERRR